MKPKPFKPGEIVSWDGKEYCVLLDYRHPETLGAFMLVPAIQEVLDSVGGQRNIVRVLSKEVWQALRQGLDISHSYVVNPDELTRLQHSPSGSSNPAASVNHSGELK